MAFVINNSTSVGKMDKAIEILNKSKEGLTSEKALADIDEKIKRIERAKNKVLKTAERYAQVYPNAMKNIYKKGEKSSEMLLSMARIGSAINNAGSNIHDANLDNQNISVAGGNETGVLAGTMSSIFKGPDGKFQVAKLEKAALGVAAVGFVTQTPIGLGALSLVGTAATWLFSISPIGAGGLAVFAGLKALKLLKKVFSPIITNFKQKQAVKNAIGKANEELNELNGEFENESDSPLVDAFKERIEGTLGNLVTQFQTREVSKEEILDKLDEIIKDIDASKDLTEEEKEELKQYLHDRAETVFPGLYEKENEEAPNPNEQPDEEQEKIKTYKEMLDKSINQLKNEIEALDPDDADKIKSIAERLTKLQESIKNTKYLTEEEKQAYTNELLALNKKIYEKQNDKTNQNFEAIEDLIKGKIREIEGNLGNWDLDQINKERNKLGQYLEEYKKACGDPSKFDNLIKSLDEKIKAKSQIRDTEPSNDQPNNDQPGSDSTAIVPSGDSGKKDDQNNGPKNENPELQRREVRIEKMLNTLETLRKSFHYPHEVENYANGTEREINAYRAAGGTKADEYSSRLDAVRKEIEKENSQAGNNGDNSKKDEPLQLGDGGNAPKQDEPKQLNPGEGNNGGGEGGEDKKPKKLTDGLAADDSNAVQNLKSAIKGLVGQAKAILNGKQNIEQAKNNLIEKIEEHIEQKLAASEISEDKRKLFAELLANLKNEISEIKEEDRSKAADSLAQTIETGLGKIQ